MLYHGGLTYFSLSNGWIIQFCTSLGYLNRVFGMPQESLTAWMSTQSDIGNWLWPGRPPDSFLEHTTTASVCTALVALSFTLTMTSALL